MVKGIDVSQHQGLINWQRVKDSGIEFAIIRVGVGSDFKSQDDKRAIRNMDECEKMGIPYGVYLYSYALKETDVHSEAQHTIRMIKGRTPQLGVWFDMEDADQYKRKNGLNPYENKQLLTDFCLIFMEDMKKEGYDNVGVYASYDYFKNILDLTKLRKAGKIWLAHWGINVPSIECNLWQYTSDGTVSGIAGRVDMNYIFDEVKKDEPEEDIYYPKYTGNLPLASALKSLGIDGSYQFRYKIASANGFVDYRGKYAENVKMLTLLKQGKLKKA